jgi:hypothetical protein
MKTELSLLRDLYIASPCPASWAAMHGNDQVRHCNQCNLKVYNLSQMTATDAEALLVKEEGKVCVRFYRRADGMISTRDCPKGLAARTWSLARYVAAAAFMLSVGWLFNSARESSRAKNTLDYPTMGKPGCSTEATPRQIVPPPPKPRPDEY